MSQFVSTIVQALKNRDFVFQRATNTIAQKIDFVFEAIVEYLDQNAHEVLWESIDVSNDVLIIVARIPTQSSEHQRIMSVGIPIEIIELQSKDEIVDFFISTEKMRAHQEQSLMDHINDELEQSDVLYRATGTTFDDVEFDGDVEDNNVMKTRLPGIKRTLH